MALPMRVLLYDKAYRADTLHSPSLVSNSPTPSSHTASTCPDGVPTGFLNTGRNVDEADTSDNGPKLRTPPRLGELAPPS
jgi:hypothetical protein